MFLLSNQGRSSWTRVGDADTRTKWAGARESKQEELDAGQKLFLRLVKQSALPVDYVREDLQLIAIVSQVHSEEKGITVIDLQTPDYGMSLQDSGENREELIKSANKLLLDEASIPNGGAWTPSSRKDINPELSEEQKREIGVDLEEMLRSSKENRRKLEEEKRKFEEEMRNASEASEK